MIDVTDTESAALAAALRPLGDYVAELGLTRPLADYTRDEILTLVEIVVDAFQAHLVEAHAQQEARDAAYFDAQLQRARHSPTPRHGGPC